jgi:glucose/arabinose dehydrogenase
MAMTKTATIVGASILGALLACAGALAQTAPAVQDTAVTYGDWRIDAPGVQHKITLSDLPAPLATEPKASRSEVVPRPAGAELKTLPGFTAEIIASGLDGPRVIRFAPNGDLFLSESTGGRVRVLRFAPGQTAPVREEVFAAGARPALWRRLLSAGAEPALRLCRDAWLGAALSLSKRRVQAVRRGRDHRPSAGRRRPLDARSRLFA